MEYDLNDYDPTSFASIMRRAFANVMHRYPVKEGEDGAALFARVHRRIRPMRDKLVRVYQGQFKGGQVKDVVELHQFGIAALNLINAGKSPEDVTKLSNTKLLKLAREARPQQ